VALKVHAKVPRFFILYDKERTMTAFIASLVFVVLAEMGDKTQLLAMAFATRYRWQTVMWGVFIATLVNHLFAVLLGSYLTNIVPLHYIQIAASASFILFGLWTLRGDKLNNEDRRFNFNPFWTVAIAFFFAEMGDKTQLATIALATKYSNVIQVWLGTTSGMLVADAIGIIFGIVLGKKIPERAIKWFAALIFIFFGIAGLYGSLPKHFITLPVMIGSISIILLLIYGVVRMNKRADVFVEKNDKGSKQ
jgi:putative Ca2+/H+ antiporter (TMEM165/GDT1 family)